MGRQAKPSTLAQPARPGKPSVPTQHVRQTNNKKGKPKSFDLNGMNKMLQTSFTEENRKMAEEVINAFTEGLVDMDDFETDDVNKTYDMLHNNISQMPEFQNIKNGRQLTGIILGKFFLQKFNHLPNSFYKDMDL